MSVIIRFENAIFTSLYLITPWRVLGLISLWVVASSPLSKVINKFIDIEQSKKSAPPFVGVKKKRRSYWWSWPSKIFINLLVLLPMRPYLALTNKHSSWDLIDKIYLRKKKNSLCWNVTDHVILLQTNGLHREQRN